MEDQKIVAKIKALKGKIIKLPEPFAEGGLNEKQWQDLVEAEAAASANGGANAKEVYEKGLETYKGYITDNLAANKAMQDRLSGVFSGILGQVGTMVGFEGFIVTGFVTFDGKDDMTGGCSQRRDVPIVACVHPELDDHVRTPEIQAGIVMIYFALALNLLVLCLGQLCLSEIVRIKWLSKASYYNFDKMANLFIIISITSAFFFYTSMCLFLRGVEGIGDHWHVIGTRVYIIVGLINLAFTLQFVYVRIRYWYDPESESDNGNKRWVDLCREQPKRADGLAEKVLQSIRKAGP